MATSEEQLLRELHAGVAVLRSQQSEINRRLGKIEESLEEDDAAEDEKRSAWWSWVLQITGQVVLVTGLVYVGKLIGLEVAW
jgi:hypothetical protein